MRAIEAAERLEKLAEHARVIAHSYSETAVDISTQYAEEAHALRLGAAALRASEWLDIAGAPLDGTPVDLWTHNGRYADATFTDGRWVFQGINDWGTYGNVPVVYAPTHYRRLPQPPKEEGNG
jgi:hypothetical protein